MLTIVLYLMAFILFRCALQIVIEQTHHTSADIVLIVVLSVFAFGLTVVASTL